jgi:hypothetical protein
MTDSSLRPLVKKGIVVSIDDLVQLRAEARGFSFLPPNRSTRCFPAGTLPVSEVAVCRSRNSVITNRVTTCVRSTGAPSLVEVLHMFASTTKERERSVLVLVDQRFPMFFGSRRALK